MTKVLKYFFCFLMLLCCHTLFAQTDTTATDTASEVKEVYKENTSHQLTLGFDITQPVINALVDYRKGYEFALDYYWYKELYWVVEAGWGSANLNDSNLKYTSSNSFFRVGFNKCLLTRNSPTDWDMAFIGLRYGMSFIQRSPVSYTIYDSLWGNSNGYIGQGKSFSGQWFEIVGGMRVELLKNFFAGWTIRGKFLLNSSAFQELAPIYIAGYGKGEKNAVFDFNLYLNYAIRWRNKRNMATTPPK